MIAPIFNLLLQKEEKSVEREEVGWGDALCAERADKKRINNLKRENPD